MTGIKFVTVITNREYAEDYEVFFRNHGAENVFSIFASGTADGSVLDAFGLEKTAKIVFNLMIHSEDEAAFKKGLYNEMNISAAGNGIAVFTPVDGLGGKSAKTVLLGEAPISKGEEMENAYKFVMIITIADKGNTDLVMEAARSAGATGGSVVRAKGTGARMAKFFGVSMGEEKEMVYIVAKKGMRDGIMRAIMEKAGKNSAAHGIVFSLPVDSVAGIPAFEEVVSL